MPPTTLAYRWTRRTSTRPNPAGSLPLVLSTKPPRAAPLGPRLWGSTCHAPVGSVAPAALAPPGREDTRSGEDRIGSARHSLRDAPGMTRGPRWSIAGPSPSRTWATWCSCCLGPTFLLVIDRARMEGDGGSIGRRSGGASGQAGGARSRGAGSGAAGAGGTRRAGAGGRPAGSRGA